MPLPTYQQAIERPETTVRTGRKVGVLPRISGPVIDVKAPPPHGWKQRFEPEVITRRHGLRGRLLSAG